MFPYEVSQKLIISGNFVEHYKYEKSYWVGWPRFRSMRRFSNNVNIIQNQESIRDDNVRRTRIKIRRLINSNQDLVKFMTLTFNTPCTDLAVANPLFRNFIKRLSRLYPAFKYICVPEFQPTSGRVHYHLLCNLPYIEKLSLEKIWQNGFVFIRKVDSIDNLGAYVCKYLGKANFDKRYFRKNKFFYSFNLLRPVVVDKLLEVKCVLSNLPIKASLFVQHVFSFSFFTKFLGEIQYNQYKVSDFIKVV